jgi:hypothetical protein
MKATNKMQLYRLIYYSQSVLHVSGDVFAHQQEHLTVFTASGSVRCNNKFVITGCPKKIIPFSKICLFGGRHLENFVPTGTAGLSIKTGSI